MTISMMTAWPVATRWGAGEGNWVAGGGGGAEPRASEGNQVAGGGRSGEAGPGTGKWAEDGPDRRLGLGTPPTHNFVQWASGK